MGFVVCWSSSASASAHYCTGASEDKARARKVIGAQRDDDWGAVSFHSPSLSQLMLLKSDALWGSITNTITTQPSQSHACGVIWMNWMNVSRTTSDYDEMLEHYWCVNMMHYVYGGGYSSDFFISGCIFFSVMFVLNTCLFSGPHDTCPVCPVFFSGPHDTCHVCPVFFFRTALFRSG